MTNVLTAASRFSPPSASRADATIADASASGDCPDAIAIANMLIPKTDRAMIRRRPSATLFVAQRGNQNTL
jgi:hypothetical protein